MYARVLTFDVGPDSVEASVGHFHETTVPQIDKSPGFQGATMLVKREEGMIVLLVFYTSLEALAATSGAASHVQAEFLANIKGAEAVSLDEYEVAQRVVCDPVFGSCKLE